MTIPRVISRSLAPVIEQLELEGEQVVTTTSLASSLSQVGISNNPHEVAYELQRNGWLGSLRTRGAWEFLPGSRAGAFSSGDRYIEFRAQQAVNPFWPGTLAMESAASLLGLAQRVPEKEVVSLPVGYASPKALDKTWRITRVHMPAPGINVKGVLPTWNLEGLITGIATRPSAYRDLAGLGQWLPEIVGSLDTDRLSELLNNFPDTTKQRAAYLLGASGDIRSRNALLSHFHPTSVAWLGPRRTGGIFDSTTQVNDTILNPFFSANASA